MVLSPRRNAPIAWFAPNEAGARCTLRKGPACATVMRVTGRRHSRWRGPCYVGALLLGTTTLPPAAAANPPILQESVTLSLADDEVSLRRYSLVPSDSPVLLPLEQVSSNGVWNDVTGVRGTAAPLVVDGDPDGRVTDYGMRGGAGLALTWTPAAVREPGQPNTARLAATRATVLGPPTQVVFFGESSFEFSYIEATSAEFLRTVELTVIDYSPTYTFVGEKCCEVDPMHCTGSTSCHQCWELEGKLRVGGIWDGPGMPYLTLAVHPGSDNLEPGNGSNEFQLIEHGEYCLEGTASAAGEATTLTACGMPAEPPVHDASGLQPVFADTCRVLPEGVHPTTALVAARNETEALARQVLEERSKPPPSTTASRPPSQPPSCAATSHPLGQARAWTLLLLGLIATGRARRYGR